MGFEKVTNSSTNISKQIGSNRCVFVFFQTLSSGRRSTSWNFDNRASPQAGLEEWPCRDQCLNAQKKPKITWFWNEFGKFRCDFRFFVFWIFHKTFGAWFFLKQTTPRLPVSSSSLGSFLDTEMHAENSSLSSAVIVFGKEMKLTSRLANAVGVRKGCQ